MRIRIKVAIALPAILVFSSAASETPASRNSIGCEKSIVPPKSPSSNLTIGLPSSILCDGEIDESGYSLAKNETIQTIEKDENEQPSKKEASKATKRRRKKTSQSRQGQTDECMRRLKREWRDAVNMGIAFDWLQHKTLSSRKESVDSKPCNYVRIGPMGKNLLRWHFSVSGPPKSEFDGGVYHGRVLLPKNYPFAPPRIQVFTPSGRFVPCADICLSASAFHPESWTPRWTILSLVDALRIHMVTQANEIGGMNSSPAKRRTLARKSRSWSSGGISHAEMIQSGIFPFEGSHDDEIEPRASMQHSEDVQTHQKSTTKVKHESSRPLVERQSGRAQVVRALMDALVRHPRLLMIGALLVFLYLQTL